jgi:hypothetical protein
VLCLPSPRTLPFSTERHEWKRTRGILFAPLRFKVRILRVKPCDLTNILVNPSHSTPVEELQTSLESLVALPVLVLL